jgi:hypothetical protein
MRRFCVLLSLFAASMVIPQAVDAQTGVSEAEVTDQDSSVAQPTTREERLAAYLTGAKFVGQFTVDGKAGAAPKTEEYTISKCEKLPQENLYRFTARIKYGDVDSEVPMPLKVLWSGKTPVITLDNLTIPGMGTFSARVLIHSDRYAGIWQHDAVGGHMFGKIEKAKD